MSYQLHIRPSTKWEWQFYKNTIPHGWTAWVACMGFLSVLVSRSSN